MSARALAALGLLLAGAAAHADPEDELERVQDRLLLERAALATLRDQQSSLLEVIDFVEGRARDSARRASLLERQLAALLERRARVAEQQEAVAQVVAAQVERLAPRLRALYRLKRRRNLEALLTANDFTALVRRARAMGFLLEQDLAALAELRHVHALQKSAALRVEALTRALQGRAEAAREARAQATAQESLLAELLGKVGADTSQSARLVRELEAAERRLERLLGDFDGAAPPTRAGGSFGRLRGKLPYPVHGMIEMAFGRVVNPRFNTETFQKGLDLRAPMGSPVVAVAPGKVVFAGWLKGYGNLLIVDHGEGYHTLMAHLAGFFAGVGDEVLAGDELGQVGDTGSLKGAYLYFELRRNGVAIDPKDWLEPQDG